MTTLPSIPDGEHDLARSDTPLASYRLSAAIRRMIPASAIPPPDAKPISSPPLHPPVSTDAQASPLSLPLTAPSLANTRVSISLPEAIHEIRPLDPLPPEYASADIFFAPDGTFVETTSGPAAREIKKLYDQQLGVGMSVRSPYAITAFVNQHGKHMYRIGHRDLSAPAVSAAQVEELVTQPRNPPKDEQPSRSKRRSRLSMHALLPPSMFKNTSLMSRPQTSGLPPRKPRKTRSIPDMSEYSFGGGSPTSTGHTQNFTKRSHVQSFTGMDGSLYPMSELPRSPTRAGDIFADVMGWDESSSGPKPLFFSKEESSLPAVVIYPFGAGVSFDSPARPATDFLPPPPLHVVREMHSFESAVTARQYDPEAHSPVDGPPLEVLDKPATRTRSMVSMKKITAPSPQEEETYTPLPETSMHSRYSTDVFDVLQTYRGLPRLEKLLPGSAETTVIRMSLSEDESVAPRDDPRFVIWGEVIPEPDTDDLSVSQGSLTDLSSSVHSSSASRKRSIRSQSHESASIRQRPTLQQKVIVAATIERWIGQLTSELNYDELLNFFLTYRAYITSIDLCHLLICRFHWSLGRASTPQDERARRIVRVRTFVAIRYWLLTFFTVDFIPNRDLRLLVADWLNALARDPILGKHTDGLSTVRKLKKIVRDCKEAHTPSSVKASPNRRPPKSPKKVTHVLGEKFAEAIASKNEDSDVDLDFLPDEVAPVADASGSYSSDLPNANLSAAQVGTALSPASFPLAAFSVLPQGPLAMEEPPTSLQVHHNPISRAFVNTIGRLGRWKRVLNSRSAVRPPLAPCAGVAAFDLDAVGTTGGLLAINSEVEQYIKIVERQALSPPAEDTSDNERPGSGVSVAPTLDGFESVKSSFDFSDVVVVGPEFSKPAAIGDTNTAVSTWVTKELPPVPSDPTPVELVRSNKSPSISSNSTDSLGKPLSPKSRALDISGPNPSPWLFDVVSIDDLDFSDTSSVADYGSPPGPPGLKRVQRKLPLRRDFEFVRRSESVASTALHPRDSIVSGATSSIVSTSSVGHQSTHGIQPWQMTALVDSLSDDDEGGGVEAALRRLEGQINPQKKQQNASKVDGWIKHIQERLAARDYSNGEPDSEEEDEMEEPDWDAVSATDNGLEDISEDVQVVTVAPPQTLSVGGGDRTTLPTTPLATQPTHRLTPTPTLPIDIQGSKPAARDGPPVVEYRHRSSTRLSLSEPNRKSVSAGLRQPGAPKPHRSFILSFRAETVVEHFSMIDRELFMSIKFEELASTEWASCEEMNVLDWMKFLKDRVQWKAESLWPQKTTALAAVRARFNLIANFTASEVVLTQLSERALVVGKFIRIAWKAYSLRNFHALVAIIAGLQSEWVSRAMHRSWSRIGVWETRMYKDLRDFTTTTDDFKYIRRTVDAITDAKPVEEVGSRAVSMAGFGVADSGNKINADSNTATAKSCVPFIGVYLSQMHAINQLPDLIDPSAPNEGVRIDPATSNFDPPAHPEVFTSLEPLPASMQLEPLINVHKQRLIAGVIKSLVAGQHHASRVQFPVDKKTLQKCLRLRALDSDSLYRALARDPE